MSSDPSQPSVGQEPSAERLTVLIVNDDPDSLFLLKHAVKRALPEAKIFAATDGREGLELWWEERASAIITDNRMPHLTGIMMTRRIRENDPSVPIIMVTGASVDREEALRAGVTIYYTESDCAGVAVALKKCLGLS